ncbi:PH domain-containing protein [Halorussus halophilus]|uniref:PH domain-containing protein n=1 Tax=Halorussus halophilus TaxID=2650975 RepID=UPI001300E947|nr:PH domain-containing protein [Halorussus halophilus]
MSSTPEQTPSEPTVRTPPDETNLPEWVTLGSAEQVVWLGRPSPYIVKKWLAIWVGLVLVGLAVFAVLPPEFQLLATIAFVASVPVAAWAYVRYRNVRYVVTSEKIYKKTGVTRRNLETVRLSQIQNVSMRQTLGQRLVSCGDLFIDTAGTGRKEVVLTSVPRPEYVNGILTDRIEGA